MKKLAGGLLLVLLSCSIGYAGKGFSSRFAREYLDISMDRVVALAETALENQQFAITDIDRAGEELIITTLKYNRSGETVFRFLVRDGYIQVVVATKVYVDGALRDFWKELDAAVVEAGGTARQHNRQNGNTFLLRPGQDDWVRVP